MEITSNSGAREIVTGYRTTRETDLGICEGLCFVRDNGEVWATVDVVPLPFPTEFFQPERQWERINGLGSHWEYIGRYPIQAEMTPLLRLLDEGRTNLAPRPDETQRAAQVARRIEYAFANGVSLDDGNVIDYLADNMTRASLSELRVALARTIYAPRFPKACQPRPVQS